jgi:hypothetical protein
VTHILRPGKASEKTPKGVIPPSLCEISQNASRKKKVQPYLMPLRNGRNLKKADWLEFARHIDEAYKGYYNPLLWSPAEIDRSTSKLHSIIVEALDVVAPIKPYRPKRSVFSWWRADLDALHKK